MQILKSFWNIKFIFLIIFVVSILPKDTKGARARARSCSTISIPNAVVRFKHNYRVMRISCIHGFTLQGSNFVGCENGKWNAEMPFCAKEGCTRPDKISNGFIISNLYRSTLYCRENYKLYGGKIAYCNGSSWDRPLGECRASNDTVQLSCDFEADDLCGWSHDETHNFDWKRIMAANVFQQLRTGPQHDHTTQTANAGHYMLMESFDQVPHTNARLVSPVYSKDLTEVFACFKFYYFMYGATVGSLNIYVRPLSMNIDEVLEDSKYKLFSISGNQKNIWKEGIVNIKELQDDFQIIIEGTAGTSHLSDIAIDDVQLMPFSECVQDATTTTAATKQPEVTEYAIYDVQSCEGRCNENSTMTFGIRIIDGNIYKMCDCHSECEDTQTCCPNYRSVCEFATTESTEYPGRENPLLPSENMANSSARIYSMSTVISPTTLQENTTTRAREFVTTFIPELTTTTATTIIKPTTDKVTETTYISYPFILNTSASAFVSFDDRTTQNLISISSTSIKPNIVVENSTTDNVIYLRKEKTVTWKVENSTALQNKNPIVGTVLCIVILSCVVYFVAVTIRNHGRRKKMRIRHLFRFSSVDGENSTLIINDENGI